MTEPVAGVLLAAGSGSRLGQPKALVELGGSRLVDRGIGLLQAGGAGPLGPRSSRVSATATAPRRSGSA